MRLPVADSLAFRLVAGAALWCVAALGIGGYALSESFRDTAEAAFDARLGVLIESLVVASEPGAPLPVVRPLADARFRQPYSGWYWQIAAEPVTEEAPETSMLVRSRSLFDAVLEAAPLGEDQMAVIDLKGPDRERLRVATRRIELAGALYRYTVAGDTAEVDAEVARFNGTLIWSLGLLGAGLLAAVLFQVRFGLQPLRRVSRALADIRLGRAAKLEGKFPAEVRPLADELNALIDHNEAVLERARTHVGNLGHALKTPLSVLTNEAAAHDHPLAEIVRRQTTRMRRQVEHHALRARAAGARTVLGARTPLAPVIDDLRRALTRIHAERGLRLDVTCDTSLAFRGERQDLEEMIGNLLDNACKWAASHVRVTGEADGGRARITVEEDGPGLPPEKAEEIIERGVRLDETVPGTGLGLAIVRDIAALYGGTLTLGRADLGGLRATLDLPAAQAR